MSGDKKYEYTKAFNDHMEMWGPNCGAPKSVYRGHLEILLKAARDAATSEFTTLHRASEWKEADGAVLWWRLMDGVKYVVCVGTAPDTERTHIRTHWSRIPKVQCVAERLPLRQGEAKERGV